MGQESHCDTPPSQISPTLKTVGGRNFGADPSGAALCLSELGCETDEQTTHSLDSANKASCCEAA